MIFALSFILPFGSFLFFFIRTIILNKPFWLGILFGLSAFILSFALVAIIAILLLIFLGKYLAKHYNPKGKFRNYFIQDISRVSCFWLGVRIKVEGLEMIPKDNPFVIYTNHQSFLDMFIFFLVLKDYPHASLYKDAHDRNPIIGPIAKSLGGMGIDRHNDYKTAEVIIKVIREVKKGVNFMIYPEGTRSKGPYLNDFRAGSFKVVQKSGANLVILAHDGAYRIARRMPFRITNVVVKIAEVISNDQIKNINTHELSDYVHLKIENTINEMRKSNKKLWIPKHFLKDKKDE